MCPKPMSSPILSHLCWEYHTLLLRDRISPLATPVGVRVIL